MSIKDATRATANAFCGPATLNRATDDAFDADGNLVPASDSDTPITARWAVFTEALRRIGMPDLPKIARIPDPGFAPAIDDILTIKGESMSIQAVRRSPEAGVYYVGGQ